MARAGIQGQEAAHPETERQLSDRFTEMRHYRKPLKGGGLLGKESKY